MKRNLETIWTDNPIYPSNDPCLHDIKVTFHLLNKLKLAICDLIKTKITKIRISEYIFHLKKEAFYDRQNFFCNAALQNNYICLCTSKY